MAQILVVDDEINARYLLRALLEPAGHRVLEATNGVEALETLRESGAELVISDGMMPKMNGFRLCLEIKQDKHLSSVPFLLYTGTFTAPADFELASEMKADAYLLKPSPPSQILSAVSDLLSKSRVAKTNAVIESDSLTGILQKYGRLVEGKLDKRERELQTAEQTMALLRSVLDFLPLLVLTFNEAGSPDFMNGAAREFMSDAAPGDLLDLERLGNLLHPDDAGAGWELFAAVREDERPRSGKVRMLRRDGQYRLIEWSWIPLRRIADGPPALVVAAQDITEQQQYSDLLVYLAERDPLTDLPNRRVLDTRFETALASLADGETFALLFIDVDRFKSVNDEFGHDVGDAVLVKLARLLAEVVGPTDTVFRLGGDEFVVLCERTDARRAAQLSESIQREVMTASLLPVGRLRRLTVSIGAQLVPEVDTAQEALRAADARMYEDKKRLEPQVVRDTQAVAGEPATLLLATYSLDTGALTRVALRDEMTRQGSDGYASGGEKLRVGLQRTVSRSRVESAIEAISGTHLECVLPLTLADFLDSSIIEHVQEHTARHALDPGRVAFEISAAQVRRSELPTAWVRLAHRAGLRLVLEVSAVEYNDALGIGLDDFDELEVPAMFVWSHDELRSGQIDSLILRAREAGLSCTLTGAEADDANRAAASGFDRICLKGGFSSIREIPVSLDW